MSEHPLSMLGYIRLKPLLRILPISKSSFYAGIKSGKFPCPVKLGPRTSAWRISDIAIILERFAAK